MEKDKQMYDNEKLSTRRMRHCQTCTLFTSHQSCNSKASGIDVNTGEVKSGCGCYMPNKTKLKFAKCPLSKW